MTIIWYLGYAQHFDEDIHMSVKTVNNIFLLLESSNEEVEER